MDQQEVKLKVSPQGDIVLGAGLDDFAKSIVSKITSKVLEDLTVHISGTLSIQLVPNGVRLTGTLSMVVRDMERGEAVYQEDFPFSTILDVAKIDIPVSFHSELGVLS